MYQKYSRIKLDILEVYQDKIKMNVLEVKQDKI